MLIGLIDAGGGGGRSECLGEREGLPIGQTELIIRSGGTAPAGIDAVTGEAVALAG